MSDTFHLTARVGFGLEAVVSRELKALGFDDLKSEDGRCRVSGHGSLVKVAASQRSGLSADREKSDRRAVT